MSRQGDDEYGGETWAEVVAGHDPPDPPKPYPAKAGRGVRAPGARRMVALRATDEEWAGIVARAAEAGLPVGRYLVEREAEAAGCGWQVIGAADARLCGERSAGRYRIAGRDEPARALCARHLDLALAAGWRMEQERPSGAGEE